MDFNNICKLFMTFFEYLSSFLTFVPKDRNYGTTRTTGHPPTTG